MLLTTVSVSPYNVPRSQLGNIVYIGNDYILLKVQTTILGSKNDCLSPGSPSFRILGVSKLDQTTRAITQFISFLLFEQALQCRWRLGNTWVLTKPLRNAGRARRAPDLGIRLELGFQCLGRKGERAGFSSLNVRLLLGPELPLAFPSWLRLSYIRWFLLSLFVLLVLFRLANLHPLTDSAPSQVACVFIAVLILLGRLDSHNLADLFASRRR